MLNINSKVRYTLYSEMSAKDVNIRPHDNDVFRPVRKIPKQRFYSKCECPDGAPLHFNSKLEQDYFTLLNFEDEIEHVLEHPLKIEFQNSDNEMCSFKPDLLFHFVNNSNSKPGKKRLLVLLKYQEELEQYPAKIKLECEAAKKVCESEGWDFKLIVDTDINYDRLDNIKFLQSYDIIEDGFGFDETIAPIIIKKIQKIKSSTPKKLIKSLTKSEDEYIEFIPYFWHLVRWGHICVDLNQPLLMNSKIWHPKAKN